MISFRKFSEADERLSSFILYNEKSSSEFTFLVEDDHQQVRNIHGSDELLILPVENRFVAFYSPNEQNDQYVASEKIRKAAVKFASFLNDRKIKSVAVHNTTGKINFTRCALEGITLSNYQFLKYRKDKIKAKYALEEIVVVDPEVEDKHLQVWQNVLKAVYYSRDLVNEPLSYLTAEQFAREMENKGKTAGYKTEVFNKTKIESLRMGGILAVNRGSQDPPTFTIMEWNPENATNKSPVVLVGKGVVYDTGGMSLKPTPNSMDLMKSDMGGAAAIAGAMKAVAMNKLPVHVIGLIPASDNRPGENAYVPGDIITMYDGTTVEVRNTDAEGRLLLGDALAYAKKFSPELVIDVATLTGAAVRSVGQNALAGMSNASSSVMKKLKASGYSTHERIITFPLWDDYLEEMKSDIADLNNLGGPLAGQITAAKFLEHFTDYPWVHLEVPGAFLTSQSDYRPKGGTGVGVRLLYDFLENYTEK